ncbi:hypothetical protein V5735_11270 (plasmid) [Haladaptatus sp. SPP-AMP-3]|uniref:hypothetical protein n=1 Tax=Haladaptatus sp. SPP-AMP-3 TaxID=3121295 RepID=UPI003C2D2DE9
MQLRPPRFRPFSVALGLFVGTAVAAALPWLWSDAPANEIEIGLLVTLLGWTAAEQFRDELDRAVCSRLHRSLAVAGVLPFAGVFLAEVFTDYDPTAGIILRLSVFAVVALVATSLGSSRHAEILYQTRSVRANVIGTKSRLYELPLTLVSSAIGIAVVKLILGEFVTVEFLSVTLVGTLIGTTIGSLLTGNQEVGLVALDDGLLVRPNKESGGSLVPWRRIRDVRIDGDTLRVTRGLPWPMVYEADLSSAIHPEAAPEAFRSQLRSP